LGASNQKMTWILCLASDSIWHRLSSKWQRENYSAHWAMETSLFPHAFRCVELMLALFY
jgi:hypothetical protein